MTVISGFDEITIAMSNRHVKIKVRYESFSRLNQR